MTAFLTLLSQLFTASLVLKYTFFGFECTYLVPLTVFPSTFSNKE